MPDDLANNISQGVVSYRPSSDHRLANDIKICLLSYPTTGDAERLHNHPPDKVIALPRCRAKHTKGSN